MVSFIQWNLELGIGNWAGCDTRTTRAAGSVKRVASSLTLLVKIDLLDPLRTPRHQFVGNGADPPGYLLHGQLGTKEDHIIAFLHPGNIGDIYHGHVHADRPDDRGQP